LNALDEGEVLHTPCDQTKHGIPLHSTARKAKSSKPKRGILWDGQEAQMFQGGVWGVYPKGWLGWALRVCGLTGCAHHELLHVCSGGLGRDVIGIRVDLRPAANPDVVGDGRHLPFADRTFRGVLLDPPYSVEYAEQLYGTDYPRPSHLIAEAARVVRPGGVIGLLHFLVPNPPEGCDIVGVWGVTQGCGYGIRAFTVWRKQQAGLFDGTRAAAGGRT
jgi:SAM-dependent methyltransferase